MGQKFSSAYTLYGNQPTEHAEFDGYAVTPGTPGTATLTAAVPAGANTTKVVSLTWVSGTIAVGQQIFGPGIPDGCYIVSAGTLALPATLASNGTVNVSVGVANIPAAVNVVTDTSLPNGPCQALYITGAGNVNVILACGATAVLTAIPAGTIVPIEVESVLSTSTTATGIFALYRGSMPQLAG